MSSFKLPDSDVVVHSNGPQTLSKDQLLSFRPFKEWLNTFQLSLKAQKDTSHTFHDAPYKLRYVQIQAIDFFGGERIGFIKMKTEVTNDAGEKLPGSVFLRGGSVAMLVQCLTAVVKAHADSTYSCFCSLMIVRDIKTRNNLSF